MRTVMMVVVMMNCEGFPLRSQLVFGSSLAVLMSLGQQLSQTTLHPRRLRPPHAPLKLGRFEMSRR